MVGCAFTSTWRKPFTLNRGTGWALELVDQDVLGKRPVFHSCRDSKPVFSGLQLKVIRWDVMECTDVAQDWDKWQAVVDTEMNRWVSWNTGDLMASLWTAGCSRRTQLLGVAIKYSLYHFAHKISVVVSLRRPRLCEIGYQYTMGFALFCQAVVQCSPHNTDIPFFCLNYSSVNLSDTNNKRRSEHWQDVCLLLARLLQLPTRKQRRHFQNPQPDSALCYSWFKSVELYFIPTYTPAFKGVNAVAVQLYVLYVREHISKIYSRLVC